VRTSKPRIQTARSPAIRKRDKKKRAKGSSSRPKGRENKPLTCKQKHRLNCVQDTVHGREWQIKQVPERRSDCIGIHISSRSPWIGIPNGPTGPTELPYINRSGGYTGSNLYQCSYHPQRYISTVVSTVFRRLKSFSLRHKRNTVQEFNKRQDIFLRAAAYYSMTRNSYFLNRFLFMSTYVRQKWRAMSSLVHRFANKVDDNTWFVYSHACLQAKWLTLRAARPRDKSTNLNRDFPFRNITNFDSIGERISKAYDCTWHVFTKMSQL
jgi:hypothetical protein